MGWYGYRRCLCGGLFVLQRQDSAESAAQGAGYSLGVPGCTDQSVCAYPRASIPGIAGGGGCLCGSPGSLWDRVFLLADARYSAGYILRRFDSGSFSCGSCVYVGDTVSRVPR